MYIYIYITLSHLSNENILTISYLTNEKDIFQSNTIFRIGFILKLETGSWLLRLSTTDPLKAAKSRAQLRPECDQLSHHHPAAVSSTRRCAVFDGLTWDRHWQQEPRQSKPGHLKWSNTSSPDWTWTSRAPSPVASSACFWHIWLSDVQLSAALWPAHGLTTDRHIDPVSAARPGLLLLLTGAGSAQLHHLSSCEEKLPPTQATLTRCYMCVSCLFQIMSSA